MSDQEKQSERKFQFALAKIQNKTSIRATFTLAVLAAGISFYIGWTTSNNLSFMVLTFGCYIISIISMYMWVKYYNRTMESIRIEYIENGVEQ